MKSRNSVRISNFSASYVYKTFLWMKTEAKLQVRMRKMAKDKDKHPSWFKMKLERRELIKQLSPETAVNVLLACWDFLETGEKPVGLSPIESVAFSAFMPDMKEAWERYIQRINAKASGNRTTSVDVE